MNTVQKMVLIPFDRYQRMQESRDDNQVGEGVQLSTDIILASIPKQYQYKVRAILMHIKQDPKRLLTWNEKGELIYHGQVIAGTHISDLLKDTQRKYQSFSPVGVEQFRQGLSEIHLPSSLLGHTRHSENVSRPVSKTRTPGKQWGPPGTPHRPMAKQAIKWASI